MARALTKLKNDKKRNFRKKKNLGPVRSLFYSMGYIVYIFAAVLTKIYSMLFKVSILIIYLVVMLRICIKWKKCRFAVAGNEMILFQTIVPVALVAPCEIESLFLRVCLHISLFGFCFFWYLLFPKGIRIILESVAISLAFLMVCELFVYYGNFPSEGYLYLAIGHLLWIYLYVTFLLRFKEETFLKSILSMERLCNAFVIGILPAIIGIGLLVLFYCLGMHHYVMGTFAAILSVVPLVFLYCYKPACLSYNEALQIRKKAYLLGRVVRSGQVIEDEGGIINSNVIEDARILQRIMTLFEDEKIYRNYDIKISDVARRIGTNKTYLSRTLNTRVSKNFCQFVNHYRIREICLLYLEDPRRDLKELGEQCGFNSQSNFSIVFKYNTGFTPGDWCRMVKAKLEKNEPVEVDDYLL